MRIERLSISPGSIADALAIIACAIAPIALAFRVIAFAIGSVADATRLSAYAYRHVALALYVAADSYGPIACRLFQMANALALGPLTILQVPKVDRDFSIAIGAVPNAFLTLQLHPQVMMSVPRAVATG